MASYLEAELEYLRAAGVLGLLLRDKTTGRRIIWGTDVYAARGVEFGADREMTLEQVLTPGVIKRRADKADAVQSARTKRHAEVFTPLGIATQMIAALDSAWWRRRTDGFALAGAGEKVAFSSHRTWQQYVDSRRLEITCGEAPYLTQRYDTATGELVPLAARQGLLDRKLRIVSENAADETAWRRWARRALESTYGYEFSGDSLLIARVNVLLACVDSYRARWESEPTAAELRRLANVVVWNIWQMNGLTGLVPYAPTDTNEQMTLWGESEPVQARCRIYDWRRQNSLAYSAVNTGGRNMKFKFVIGNPPYQEERQGDSNTATPIYHNFMEAAYNLADKVMLITPARFLFNAGYTPKDWNKKMLNDEHLKVVSYSPVSASVFRGVDIKGGVAITYRDKNSNFGAIKVFNRYSEMNQILHKVIDAKEFKGLNTIIVTSFAYHYTKTLYEENLSLVGRASKGHDYDIQSNAFTVFPEVFFDTIPDNDDYIRILGRDGKSRSLRYIKRRYVTNVSNLDSYKVFYAKATGTGAFGEILPNAIIGEPADGATVTYFSMGQFDTEEEAKNCVQYTKTKFARALLGVLKVTQDNTPGKWAYVPLQDFTASSDIDWSKSIPEIDRQLYAKYGLTAAEVDFIESHVKEMA